MNTEDLFNLDSLVAHQDRMKREMSLTLRPARRKMQTSIVSGSSTQRSQAITARPPAGLQGRVTLRSNLS